MSDPVGTPGGKKNRGGKKKKGKEEPRLPSIGPELQEERESRKIRASVEPELGRM